jgi:hypothetical protein
MGIRLYSYTFLTISDSFDYNDLNGGTSFKVCYEDWRKTDFGDDFIKWGAECFGKNILPQGKSTTDAPAF